MTKDEYILLCKENDAQLELATKKHLHTSSILKGNYATAINPFRVGQFIKAAGEVILITKLMYSTRYSNIPYMIAVGTLCTKKLIARKDGASRSVRSDEHWELVK